jgi:CBS domain-containing protein
MARGALTWAGVGQGAPTAVFVLAPGSGRDPAVVAAHGLEGLRVRDIMTSRPVTLRADDTVDDALRVVHGNDPAAFPVLEDDGGLVGVVASDDLLCTPLAAGRPMRLRGLVHELATTASPDEPAEVAFVRMIVAGQDQLVVMEEGRLAGLVTKRDFWRHM